LQRCENNCGALPHAFIGGDVTTSLRMTTVARLAHAIAAGILVIASASAETLITDLPLAGIGSQRVLYAAPAHPHAILLMLPGGDGRVEIANDGLVRRLGQNFLLRTLPLWQSHGFAVVVLTPPNDMSLFGYRQTAAYATMIGQAVDFVRDRARLPVWLVGTSQGSTAAVSGGARLGDKVAGIVLISSVTGRSSSGETLFDSEPGLVTVPALIVANTGDACAASPPSDAPKIAAALARAPRKEVVYMQSVATEGQPCEAKSPHGFFGIEEATVARIAERIDAASGQ
jgi:pimeloyl-ACP methyl ester carboxylesterase